MFIQSSIRFIPTIFFKYPLHKIIEHFSIEFFDSINIRLCLIFAEPNTH